MRLETRDGRGVKNQKQDEGTQNRYCTCSTESCNCCRDFSLPVIPIRGPGCATLQYLQGDNMALSMKFGDRVLTNTTISGRKPRPVCMNLPGGYSQFCGRVYGISRDPEAFHACLGVEIRALDDVEAALRLSCFRFSPEGLRVEPGKPIPPDEDDEDEDEDDYGFGVDDDDDDEDEEEEEDETEESEDEDDDDVDELDAAGVGDDNEISTDYAGFSILGDLFGFGDDSLEEPPKKKPNKKVPTPAPVAVVDKVPQQQPAPVAVVVHVSPLHNTPVVIETITQSVNNNKDTSTVAPSSAPTKAPNKARPKPRPTKAPTQIPAEAPTKAPEVVPPKVPEAAPTTMPSVASTEAPFQAITSTEFTVNVLQDGQTLQPMVEEAENEKDSMMEATTMVQEEENMEEENNEEGENMSEEMENVPAADIMTNEEAMEDEKAEEATEEVGIGVVKDEEPQAEQGIMMTTEMTSEPMETATVTEAPKLPPTPQASPTAPAVVTTTAGKDEDEEEADSVVEEVEEAVATVMGQGEEDEEDEDDEESEEEDEENTEGDKEDDDYDLGVDLDDLEEEEGDKTEAAPTEDVSESPRPASGERRWRKRKNRLDHIIWH
ncbi:hypothetical protein J437_LFUL009377 [Ladona fulva]|uniref:DUF4773 domain-containing protein n=1 Tax=Ladona fulva TaxID=123851 RepID=A0A8K0K4R6_LADFU|nr:hypothetical protein J437_LFUL009377 [Ladona fulva]